MAGLFATRAQGQLRTFPPEMRQAIRELHAEYPAFRQHGAPEALVSDSGGVFRATQALRFFESLGIRKEQIERRQSWQSYIETQFNVQRHMAAVIATEGFETPYRSPPPLWEWGADEWLAVVRVAPYAPRQPRPRAAGIQPRLFPDEAPAATG